MKNKWFFSVVMIAWFSLILFLLDFANRSGNWKMNMTAMAVVIFTVAGCVEEINKEKKKSDIQNKKKEVNKNE